MDARYYTNEFRWFKNQSVQAYKYYSADTTDWTLTETFASVVLLEAAPIFTAASLALAVGAANLLM